MGKVVLITDINTPLGFELAKRYIDSGSSLIAASDSDNRIESFLSLSAEKYLQIKWSRKSPISARNVVLSGLNHFKHIDEAVILQILNNQPSKIKDNNFGDMQFAEIESIIDTQVKGSLFLIKELAHYVTGIKDKDKGNVFSFVQYYQEAVSHFSPLGALIINGSEYFVKSLANTGIDIRGFYSAAGSVTEYADFIFKTIKVKTGKSKGRIFRFSNRQSIFIKKQG